MIGEHILFSGNDNKFSRPMEIFLDHNVDDCSLWKIIMKDQEFKHALLKSFLEQLQNVDITFFDIPYQFQFFNCSVSVDCGLMLQTCIRVLDSRTKKHVCNFFRFEIFFDVEPLGERIFSLMEQCGLLRRDHREDIYEFAEKFL